MFDFFHITWRERGFLSLFIDYKHQKTPFVNRRSKPLVSLGDLIRLEKMGKLMYKSYSRSPH